VLTCLSIERRAKVAEMRSFNDLDGHIWEIIHMDPSAIKPS
jgi:predicted lactoylglutathione lyase